MGAIAAVDADVETVRDERVFDHLQVDEETFERAREREIAELRRRETAYRQGRPATPLVGRPVILVDDGLATGSTMRAAALAVRQLNPARVVVAVPVAAAETCDDFRDVVDEIVCSVTPRPFRAVGLWYEDFSQTSDEEAGELLTRANEPAEAPQ
jgi:predicted phosphoribosyltransferase